MTAAEIARIKADPRFRELERKRNAFSWTLCIIMLIVYFAFIFLVAFGGKVVATPVWGVVTLAFPLGLGVIVLAIVLTGVYVDQSQRRIRRPHAPTRVQHGREADRAMNAVMIKRMIAGVGAMMCGAGAAYAAGALDGPVQQQEVNTTAIVMFVGFVILTLGITYWASQRTRSAADFYTAGGGITGFQNGLAIAGDYMSAASFLGISALVYSNGYDGLIYSIGFLVGWPIIMFLMAERLRNLGRFTFADVVSFRMAPTPMRILSATGTLIVVAFYLIAQMVGAGQLIQLLFGLPYLYAVIIVGVLMICYVTFGGMLATTWVQIIKAVLLLGGAQLHGAHGAALDGLEPAGPVRQGGRGLAEEAGDHGPRQLRGRPGLDHLARHRADVRDGRVAAHPDALLYGQRRQGSPQVGVLGDDVHRLFLHPHLHHRLRRDRAGEHGPDLFGGRRRT